MKRFRRLRYTARLLVLMSLAGATAGCMVLHLREFKKQLSQFDQFFTVNDQPRPTVVALNPVMLSRDVAELLRLEPSTAIPTDRGVLHTYHFQKEKAPADSSTNDFDLVFTMLFVDDRMAELGFSNRYSDFINMDALRHMFQSIGQADVDAQERRASWKAPTSADDVSKLDDLILYLGQPSLSQDVGIEILITYNYRLKRSAGEGDAEPDACFKLSLQSDNHRLLKSDVRIGHLGFKIDFSKK